MTLHCRRTFVISSLPAVSLSYRQLGREESPLVRPEFEPWMKEERDKTSRGGGLPALPAVSTSVHFSLRNEGSSEHILLCEGRESLSPNFQTFLEPQASIPRNW